MNKLSKYHLWEFAQVLVLANTPISLLNGMIQCAGMEQLRKSSPADLVPYYDQITARARRTEVVVALAYAVLCAILLKARDTGRPPVDPSRLLWGNAISKYLAQTTVSTQSFTIEPQFAAATVQVVGSPSSEFTGQVLGADGRPMIWREAND